MTLPPPTTMTPRLLPLLALLAGLSPLGAADQKIEETARRLFKSSADAGPLASAPRTARPVSEGGRSSPSMVWPTSCWKRSTPTPAMKRVSASSSPASSARPQIGRAHV